MTEKINNQQTLRIPIARPPIRKSDYRSVVEFNQTFGVPVYETPQWDIFDANPDLVKLRMDLIREEFFELQDAVKKKDFIETVDALADLIYVVHGMAASIGVDMDKAFDIVHRSNMSKLCKTEQEARDTVEWYKSKGHHLGYDSPAYKKHGHFYVVYNDKTKKVLKNIRYVKASFEYLRDSNIQN